MSGLVHSRHILQDTPGIGHVQFSASDVVRHQLVSQVIAAYNRDADNKHKE